MNGSLGPRIGYPVTVTVYAEDDGRIVSVLTTTEEQLERNIPAGCGYIDGAHDGRTRRVNLVTKEVEAFQPPQDDTDAVWDAEREVWEIPAAILARRRDNADAVRRIELIERTQLRALREIALGIDPVINKAKLKLIDDQIVELRASLLT